MKSAKRRQRLRGTCKWGGLTLCVLLFALWLVSGWWALEFPSEPQSSLPIVLIIEAGSVHLQTPMYVREPVGFRGDEFRQREIDLHTGSLEADLAQLVWTIRATDDDWWGARVERSRYWHWWEWSLLKDPARHRMWITFPLWLLFLLIALPTGFLFWSDHRRCMRAGCCAKCGYNLTGNTSGKCPECGKTTAARESS